MLLSLTHRTEYGLHLMGHDWDKVLPPQKVWEECYKVLRPGAFCLSFGHCRLYHRLCCQLEDAGFVIKDCLCWCYASAMPRSLNIFDSLSKDISKAMDNIELDYLRGSRCLTLNNLSDVTYVTKLLEKTQIKAGMNIGRKNIVVDNVVVEPNHKRLEQNVTIVERRFCEALRTQGANIIIVIENVEAKQTPSLSLVKYAEKLYVDQNLTSEVIFIAQVNVKDMLKDEATIQSLGGEVQKIWHGKEQSTNDTDTSAIFVAVLNAWKLTILKALTPTQSLDMMLTMEGVCAMTAIFTKSTMEQLITSTEDILRETNKMWEGWGTTLKTSWEPIVVAQKPLEGTYIENIRKYKVGALNIDECRIPYASEEDKRQLQGFINFEGQDHGNEKYFSCNTGGKKQVNVHPGGRWPANLLWLDPLFADYDHIFIVPKPPKSEKRKYNEHDTVKPLHLMERLIKLITPRPSVVGEKVIVLDPFMGSGSTGVACKQLARDFVGYEIDKKSFQTAHRRLSEKTGRYDIFDR